MSHHLPFSRDEAVANWSRLVAGWADHLDASGARLLIDGVTNVHDRGGSYEGVTRMLWGLGSWLSVTERSTTVQWRGVEYDILALTRRALLNGTDPESSGYWGVPAISGSADQRTVESGQVAFALWQSRAQIWEHMDTQEQKRIVDWLEASGERPAFWRNNWALFWALNHHVRAALGASHDPALVEDVLDYLDTVYCGDGWYDDGPGPGTNHFDDYNLWVFSSHVLAWAQIEPEMTERKSQLLDRVRLQMTHVPWFFAADGAYTEYGRSLSYKFGRLGSLLWAHHAGVWPHSTGMLKHLVGRHLRWYLDRGAVRADGSLRQELTSEGSVAVRETYISTGATYWAMQAFGGLWTLSDDDPFWSAIEEPLPVEEDDFIRVMKQPGFVLVGTQRTGAVQRFSAKSNHYAAKYGKFHYTTAAPFNVGLADGEPLPDGMLSLTDGVNRGHRSGISASATGDSGWLRFRYGQSIGRSEHSIETIIVPIDEAHLRIHRITLDSSNITELRAIDGAAALGYPQGAVPTLGCSGFASWGAHAGVMVAIAPVRGYLDPTPPSDFGNANANSVFGQQLIPSLTTATLNDGTVLISVVHIGSVLEHPDTLSDLVRSVEFDDAGPCRIELADGTGVSVPALTDAMG